VTTDNGPAAEASAPSSASTNGAPPAAPAGWRRWSWTSLLLIGSLALNLAVMGALGHRAWEMRRNGADPLAGPAMRFLRELPGDRRTALAAQIDAVQAALRGSRGRQDTAQREAIAALTAEPFNAATFAAAMRRLPEARTDAVEPLAALAAALTPAERATLARRLMGGRGGRGKH
jgi:uncharacterized membrane protein